MLGPVRALAAAIAGVRCYRMGRERVMSSARLINGCTRSNRGEFRVGDYGEIMNKAGCLSPLSSAAVLWNTVRMSRSTQQLRDAGNQIDDEDLAHVWPLQRTRIIPNGTYTNALDV